LRRINDGTPSKNPGCISTNSDFYLKRNHNLPLSQKQGSGVLLVGPIAQTSKAESSQASFYNNLVEKHAIHGPWDLDGETQSRAGQREWPGSRIGVSKSVFLSLHFFFHFNCT
jgi:hypothetical protein